jgi:hypothetical protein
MVDDLLVSVEKHLKAHLESKGFARTEYRYMPEHFGDSYIMFKSSGNWFYLSKDKGQVFAEVGPIDKPPSVHLYFDLWYVAEFLNHTDFPRDYSGSTDSQVERITRYMQAHWDDIFRAEVLGDELRAYIRKRQQG